MDKYTIRPISLEEFLEENPTATLLEYYRYKVPELIKYQKDMRVKSLLWEAESILEILERRHSLGHITTSTTTTP
jgi:hypothetical protein